MVITQDCLPNSFALSTMTTPIKAKQGKASKKAEPKYVNKNVGLITLVELLNNHANPITPEFPKVEDSGTISIESPKVKDSEAMNIESPKVTDSESIENTESTKVKDSEAIINESQKDIDSQPIENIESQKVEDSELIENIESPQVIDSEPKNIESPKDEDSENYESLKVEDSKLEKTEMSLPDKLALEPGPERQTPMSAPCRHH